MVQILDRQEEPTARPPSYEELFNRCRQLERENEQLQQWQQKTRDIMCNPHSSPAFKALSWAQLDLYTDAVLLGEKTHIVVEKVYKHVSVSAKSATNYFKATKEIGGADYGYEHGQNEKSGKHFTESSAAYGSTFGTMPLDASKVVQQAREEERRRRDERVKSLEFQPCSRCGHALSVAAVQPYCEACQQIDETQGQVLELSHLRIAENEEAFPTSDNVPIDEDASAIEAIALITLEEPPEFADIPPPTEEPEEVYIPSKSAKTHVQRVKKEYIPPWLIPGTADWNKQVERSSESDMYSRRAEYFRQLEAS